MGVYGLQSFMERNCQGNLEIVSLGKVGRKHRKKHNALPLLAIDGLNVVESIYCNPDPWIYGGQWRNYVESIKSFVEKLQSMNIEPVFFFDGAHQESHNIQWADRRRRELDTVKTVFSNLVENIPPDPSSFVLPLGMRSFTSYILKYECSCDVRTCLGDADMAVAKFANETEACFGILANDTDYLIFDTKPLYLARKLNLETMTTEVWRRKKVADLLGLDVSYFPLISCMTGNSVISHTMLRPFHQKLALQFETARYLRLQNAVKFLQGNRKECLTIQKLSTLMGVRVDLVKESLNTYKFSEDLNGVEEREWCSEEILSLVRERCSNCESPATVYKLLYHKIYKSSAEMQDPSMYPSALLYRKMRQKMYHIIFRSVETEVKEVCAYETNSNLLNPTIVRPIRMDGVVTTLQELWGEEVSSVTRWNLFRSCIGLTIPVPQLQKINPVYVTMCCILNYLLQCTELELRDFEVKAFICQAVHPSTDDLLYLSNLKVDKIVPRAVSVVAIFLSGVRNFHNVLAVCGSPYPLKDAMPWKYFDGKLFHHCYNLLQDGGTPEQVLELTEKKELYEDLYRTTIYGSRLA